MHDIRLAELGDAWRAVWHSDDLWSQSASHCPCL